MPTRSASWSLRSRAVAALVAIGLTAGAGATPPTRAAPLTLAVVPNRPALALHRAWAPLVDRLQEETGLRFELKLYERLAPFLEATAAGIPDLFYAPPNMYSEARRAQGYVPLVRGSGTLSGVVFVRKESPYRSVKDLEGKLIAFVGPSNLCAVITRHAIATSGTAIDYNAAFAGSTINVAKMVAIGKADAGATLDVSLDADAPELLGSFRTILETPPFAPHPLAAHPRIPAAVRERITLAVLRLADDGEGARLLADAKLSRPLRAAYERDYKVFETVSIAPTPASR